MPNHVTNIVTTSFQVIEGFTRTYTAEEIEEDLADIAKTKERVKDRMPDWTREPLDPEKRIVDFNMVIPMPERIFLGGCDMRHPHPHPDGGVYDVCWSDWNRDSWGTKWNGYDSTVDLDGTRITFDTAWSHPEPVIVKLSEKFPDQEIEVQWADEDLGFNVGKYTIKNGKVLESDIPKGGSDEANEMAAQIKYGMPYEDLRKEWDQDEIDLAQRAAFSERISAERGVENGYQVIHEEGLEVPQDIKDAITTLEDTEAYYEGKLKIPKPVKD